MERYTQFLADIREARASRERYAQLVLQGQGGMQTLVDAFDNIILNLTLVLSAELEQNAHVQAYKSLCESEKAIIAQKAQYEEVEEVKLFKELNSTF